MEKEQTNITQNFTSQTYNSLNIEHFLSAFDGCYTLVALNPPHTPPPPPKQTCGNSWILFEEEKWTQSAQEFYFWFSILQESGVAKVVKDVFTNVQKFCLCSCRVFYKLVCSQLCGKYKMQQMVPICPTAKSSTKVCQERELVFPQNSLEGSIFVNLLRSLFDSSPSQCRSGSVHTHHVSPK